MDRPDIPPDVRSLLSDRIESYEHLELALVLARRPHHQWSHSEISAESNLRPDLISDGLRHLSKTECINRVDGPPGPVFSINPELTATVSALRTLYEHERVAIMQIMTRNAIDRVRTSALKAFAASFVVGNRRDG